MTKKIFIFLIVLTVCVIGYIFISKKNENIKSPIVKDKIKISPNPLPVGEKTYSDEAGFSFSYPANLLFKKIETEDQAVYSSIEISSGDHSGKLSIIVADSSLTGVDDYFKNEKTVKKLKLADLEAGQLDKNGQLVTAAFDQGVLFTIMADYQKSKAFWLTVNNKIIASFKFVLPTGQETSVQGSEGSSPEPAIIDEGEEEIN